MQCSHVLQDGGVAFGCSRLLALFIAAHNDFEVLIWPVRLAIPMQHTKREIIVNFDRREKGFESRHDRDEEVLFKAHACCNSLAGLCGVERLGLNSAEAESYAKSVALEDLEETDKGDVFHKSRKDFDAKNFAQSYRQIRRQMDELLAADLEQIKAAK
jgi:hypothetical protein